MILGCIADDFTGAGDIASFFAKGGMRTRLYNGVPQDTGEANFDAAVIALKTRTQETVSAVEDSLTALKWLHEQGAKRFYVKYCSTFDSTPRGNIGPICDASMEFLQAPYTVLCPALPVNGRVVRGGRLFVNGVPLEQSPMKNHPLTPMWASSIEELMAPQSKYPCRTIGRAYGNALPRLDAAHGYYVPDMETDADADAIVACFGGLRLLTGGSGIAEPLARILMEDRVVSHPDAGTDRPALLLAGSCSVATREQIENYRAAGGACLKLDPMALLDGTTNAKELWRQAKDCLGESVLIYSSDTPENVRKMQSHGQEKVAVLLENTFAQLACLAAQDGIRRVIVAGGETGGAVTRQLGFNAYEIGQSIAPGVPVMTPVADPSLRLVLKSGNFGQPDFFRRALDRTCRKKKGEDL